MELSKIKKRCRERKKYHGERKKERIKKLKTRKRII